MKRALVLFIALSLIFSICACQNDPMKSKNPMDIQLFVINDGDMEGGNTGNSFGMYYVGMKLGIRPYSQKNGECLELTGELNDIYGCLDIYFDEQLDMFVATVVRSETTYLNYSVNGKTYGGVCIEIADSNPFWIQLSILEDGNLSEPSYGNDLGVFHVGMELAIAPCEVGTDNQMSLSGEFSEEEGILEFQFDEQLHMFIATVKSAGDAHLQYILDGIIYSDVTIQVSN